MTTRTAWTSGKLFKAGKISRTKKSCRRTFRHYTTLGAGIVLECPGLDGRERSELYEEKRRETKIIQYLEIVSDSRKQRNEVKLK